MPPVPAPISRIRIGRRGQSARFTPLLEAYDFASSPPIKVTTCCTNSFITRAPGDSSYKRVKSLRSPSGNSSVSGSISPCRTVAKHSPQRESSVSSATTSGWAAIPSWIDITSAVGSGCTSSHRSPYCCKIRSSASICKQRWNSR